MAEKDLIPFKPKGDKRSDEYRARQKGSSSEKRKRAQKISALKRVKPEKLEEKALKMATDPEFSALEIMRMVDGISKRKDLTSSLRIKLNDSLTKAHTAIHGSKSKNINLNIDMTSEKVVERIKQFKVVTEKEKDDTG